MDKNRRNFSRVKFDSTVLISCQTKQYDAGLIDISLKGALISISDTPEIPLDQTCDFELRLNDTEIVLSVKAFVVYTKDEEYGLKFDNIDLESMIHLRRLVELNVGDPDQVQKELFFLASPTA